LGGGVILVGRDGCYRDMASMHGTWRKVEETLPAVGLVGDVMAELGVTSAVWYLDSPVSNSGRLRAALLDASAARGWDWRVEVVPDPDADLVRAAGRVVVTADSMILDGCDRWFNLAKAVVAGRVPHAYVVDLG
jgi:hypothetical protein